jgi:hypothetical protein
MYVVCLLGENYIRRKRIGNMAEKERKRKDNGKLKFEG